MVELVSRRPKDQIVMNAYIAALGAISFQRLLMGWGAGDNFSSDNPESSYFRDLWILKLCDYRARESPNPQHST